MKKILLFVAALLTASVAMAQEPYYSLVGYINGADYGCEGDYENPGDYKFENGKLTVTFDQDSYVFVKLSDNSKWFLSETYVDETAESATMANGRDFGEKMKVLAGTVEFTLAVEDEDTIILSRPAATDAPTVKAAQPAQSWVWINGVLTKTLEDGSVITPAGQFVK
ncbi:MAG: hypothetical protein MJ003_01430 [Paludibacteraceae bacterium]|nr:hypothetical protein [Paludibacteraceae bacterium]